MSYTNKDIVAVLSNVEQDKIRHVFSQYGINNMHMKLSEITVDDIYNTEYECVHFTATFYGIDGLFDRELEFVVFIDYEKDHEFSGIDVCDYVCGLDDVDGISRDIIYNGNADFQFIRQSLLDIFFDESKLTKAARQQHGSS